MENLEQENPQENHANDNESTPDTGERQGGGQKSVDDVINNSDRNTNNSTASTEEISTLIEKAVSVKAAEIEKRYAPVVEENARLKEKLAEMQEELAKIRAGSSPGDKGPADGLKEVIREKEKALEELEQKLMEERQRRIAIERDAVIDRTFERQLGNMEFTNEKARAIAKELVARDIVYDEEKGKFIHRQGLDVDEWVKLTVQDEANRFLFRPKANRGAGASPSGDSNKPKTVFDLPVEELIEKVNRGEL